MIPEFPNFKKLELSDREEIEKYTSKFPPYSDFNFTSLWSWDIHGAMKLSRLHGNLVICFTDYLTNGSFYSFLGKNKVNETATELLHLSMREGHKYVLKLIPESVAKEIDLSKFQLEEDPDNFDYIYKAEHWANFSGKKFQNKRCLFNKFKSLYPDAKFVALPKLEDKVKEDILRLDEKWANHKSQKIIDFDIKNEVQALKRFFELTGKDSKGRYMFACLYVGEELVGFSINSIIDKEHALCHFTKGNIKFQGVYEYLLSNSGKNLMDKSNLINYEQDLGLPSLRFSKNSFRPASFLKKYVIMKL